MTLTIGNTITDHSKERLKEAQFKNILIEIVRKGLIIKLLVTKNKVAQRREGDMMMTETIEAAIASKEVDTKIEPGITGEAIADKATDLKATTEAEETIAEEETNITGDTDLNCLTIITHLSWAQGDESCRFCRYHIPKL